MVNTNKLWDDDAIATLRQLWPRLEVSVRQIGIILGVSKNAAMGKAKRMGLGDRVNQPAMLAAIDLKRCREKHITTRPIPAVDKLRVGPKPLAPMQPPHRSDIRHQCQWPTGDSPNIRFECTNPAPLGISWCEKHRRIVYNPAPTTAFRD